MNQFFFSVFSPESLPKKKKRLISIQPVAMPRGIRGFIKVNRVIHMVVHRDKGVVQNVLWTLLMGLHMGLFNNLLNRSCKGSFWIAYYGADQLFIHGAVQDNH